MITISPSEQARIVEEANLAPSVHNTQPARWQFRPGEVEIYADGARFLSVGDPSLRDAGLSCGAAAEGTRIALAKRGIGVAEIEDVWNAPPNIGGNFRRAAVLKLSGAAAPDALSDWVPQRFTWRGKFAPLGHDQAQALRAWEQTSATATLITNPGDMKWIASLNDKTSLSFFRDKPYRDELVSWMRFSPSDANWDSDGLNAEAMQLSGFEAVAAKYALSSPWFEVANTLRLSGMMVSEQAKTLSASAVLFFHVGANDGAIEIGQQFYRLWLELTALGVCCWPMAVLADNPHTNSDCVTRFDLPRDRRLVNVLRLGACPPNASRPATARLAAADLILG